MSCRWVNSGSCDRSRAWAITRASMCFFLQSSSFKLSESRVLVNNFPICFCKLCCPKLPLSYTFCYCQYPILLRFYLPAFCYWCPVLVATHEKYCKFSIFLIVWAYRHICLLDVVLRIVQKIWVLALSFVWSWYIYYLVKLYHWRYSS